MWGLSLLGILVGLTLGGVDRVQAEEKAAQPTSAIPASPSNETPPTDDDLWAIPPSQVDQGKLVDFNKNPSTTLGGFDYEKAERELAHSHTFIEHHGYFRFRSDLFHRLDLGTYSASERRGSSQFLPPLSDRASTNAREEAASLASANIRFRYKPILHVNERLRVNAVMDIPDNFVLGSTVDGGPMSLNQRPDVALDILAQRQIPADQSFSLRYMWGTWETDLARFDFGRMRHHWGLGMLFNGGSCLDCNFGDAIDRIQLTTNAFDVYVSISWDFAGEGPTGYGLINQPQGQAWDWDQRDDISQYTLSLSQMAISPVELAKKRTALKKGNIVFEWGVYGVFKHQGKSSAFLDLAAAQTAPVSPEPTDEGWTLYTTNADLFIPDLYLSWTYQPKPGHEYSFKFEGASMMGEIGNIPLSSFAVLDSQVCSDPGSSIDDCSGNLLNPRRRDVFSWGYTAQFDAKAKGILWGFHHGGASGDQNGGYFGANELNANNINDQDLESFRFNRDYIVDLILFREVLGGVHNAFYFKPYFGYELSKPNETVWGVQASALYAMAYEPKWTSGQESGLGLEFDIEAYLYQTNRFRTSLAYGVYFP
jgi:uncharacterized protein (TIGR04551 family)